MSRAIVAVAVMAMAASVVVVAPAAARGLHFSFGGGHHGGHPINAWMGSHHPRLR